MSFDLAPFRKPPVQFRGAPFWALNHDLTDHDRLREQIDAFAEMGMGGYHLHVRFGLKTPYMSEDFLDAIKAAREHGASKGMLSYLYDEDTWPSGFGGGVVTRELTHRQNWMEITKGRPAQPDSKYRSPVCAYRIEQDAQGYLLGSKRIDYADGRDDDWFLTHVIQEDMDRHNGGSHLDMLSPAATQAFIEHTHEAYLKAFGGKFPADIPSIFTDEPSIGFNTNLPNPFSGKGSLAWTGDLPDTFREAWGAELLDILPEFFWPTPDGPSPWRWRLWDHLSERFAEAYSDQLGAWCEKHGIASTGHMLNEDNLPGQVNSLGECMRHYRGFQLPGIDILCDDYKPATAKQAVSVARQDGRPTVMSELYGVTNWDFDFAGHKTQGDWQAALGINLRIPHLAWLSMEGRSKLDYPAAIGPQSPWYQEYRLVEDHFSRVGCALSAGKALVRIGYIHPAESIWLCHGVRSLEDFTRNQHEVRFQQTTNWLLESCFDFDYIAESLLPTQERETEAAQLQVGEMAYDVILLANLDSIRQSTLDSLKRFTERGGMVLILGSLPGFVNGEKSSAAKDILCDAKLISNDVLSLREALEPWREIAVHTVTDGQPINSINHQIRQVGEERIVYCCNRQKKRLQKRPWPIPITEATIRLKGHWQVRELDTSTGEEVDCAYSQQGRWTLVPWDFQPQSHRLLRLSPGFGEHKLPTPQWDYLHDLPEPQSVTTEEPNCLLLDMPEWRVDDEPRQPAQDSRMTQMQLADRFHWPEMRQPYSITDLGERHRVTRRFTLHCKVDITNARLMCERLAESKLTLDGKVLVPKATGWWVDRDLPTMELPTLSAGDHILEIEQELHAVERYLEWCYLLGDFAVEIRGAHAFLTNNEKLFWGNVASQGLPFYGGNLDYTCEIDIAEAGDYALRCPTFAGHLLRIWVDGKDRGPVPFAPYRATLGTLSAGKHTVRIRCYGNRHNTFGAVHNNLPEYDWFGPPAWQVQNECHNRIWQLKPTGILRAPMIERRG
ncbi:hypothetical protein [Cerasicoccus fimbriatus]|uniref:hypothetical protein n=1 Tax=Cerasicoccus fimbriatus TaxID=3014554 RepID=UPI0022B5451E|nr:hypothetical protein [Cerasicoccus sp. TK19100]